MDVGALTWRCKYHRWSSNTALFKCVAQDSRNLAIEDFQTAAKLQLFVQFVR
jgi:hypothetical protein